jgi:hypothetical protein
MATQIRYQDFQTLSRHDIENHIRDNIATKHDIHTITGPIKLYLKFNEGKFILSYTTIDECSVGLKKSFSNPYLHNGKTIKLNNCSFSMTDKGKPYFSEDKRQKLISNGWKENEFLTYDNSDECEITISPEAEDLGKPITLKTVFTNDNHFGTRYLWQRIYFYVGDDEYPFFQMNFNKSIKEQTTCQIRIN